MSFLKETAGPSTHRFKSICILGGNDLGKIDTFRHAACDLGKVLATEKINIVYGGGIQGLKGCTAGTAITRGSQVLGVTLMNDNNQKPIKLGTRLRVSTAQERMAQMMNQSDAFIALPGGFETLEDILTILCWANCRFHQKPLGFLNINGYYDGLLSFLQQAIDQEFLAQELQLFMSSSSNADELLKQMQSLSTKLHASKKVDKNTKVDEDNEDPDTTLQL